MWFCLRWAIVPRFRCFPFCCCDLVRLTLIPSVLTDFYRNILQPPVGVNPKNFFAPLRCCCVQTARSYQACLTSASVNTTRCLVDVLISAWSKKKIKDVQVGSSWCSTLYILSPNSMMTHLTSFASCRHPQHCPPNSHCWPQTSCRLVLISPTPLSRRMMAILALALWYEAD